MRILNGVLVFLLLVVGVTFGLKNYQPVEINYYEFQWQVSLAFALFIAMALGVVVGALASVLATWRVRRELARSRRDLKRMEQEIDNLRALPIRDGD